MTDDKKDMESVDAALQELQHEHADAKAQEAEAAELLKEAQERVAEAEEVLAAATAPAPITGPRVKLEPTGEIRAVAHGEERERRLLIDGRNYEHVSDTTDQGEVIWTYRQM